MYGIWAGELGLSPDAFWASTPRQVSAILAGYANRLQREHNERAWHAWHTAALPMAKRFPRLRELMVKPKSKRRQPWREQLAIAQRWNAAVNQSSKPR